MTDLSDLSQQARQAVQGAYQQGVADGVAQSGAAQDARLLHATMLRAIAAAIETVAAAATIQEAIDALSRSMDRLRAVADRIDPTVTSPEPDPDPGPTPT